MLRSITALAMTALLLPTVQAQDLSTMSWDAIVAQAKLEGEVTWFNWYFQDRFREVVKDFEAEYGITVTIPDGDHAANFNKFLAERDRPEGDIDVMSMGGDNLSKFKPAEYFLGPLKNLLPDGDILRYDINGGVSDGYAVAFWGNQTGIAYNPEMIAASDLPQTIEQLDAYLAANPGAVGLNAANGGAGPALIQSVTRNLVPGIDYNAGTADEATLAQLQPAWDWFNAREDQFVITASNVDSLTRLNGGEFVMVSAWEDQLAGMQVNGDVSSKLRFYIPDFKMPGGGNVVGIPANAKNKAAALVFINWLTSADVQTRFNRTFGIAPQNPNASSEFALVPNEMRVNGTDWATKELNDAILAQFVEKVTLN
jgi:putative spermidine/putrescine transport system substrate-binding protein